MKVLVLSLLRVGDILMQASVFEELDQEGYDVDVLINRECSLVTPLIKGVTEFILFDRKELQNHIGEVNGSPIQGLIHLKNFATQVNEKKYDVIINLTQNRLSARLMDLFVAKKKVGLQYFEKKLGGFQSSWLEYMNLLEEDFGPVPFHFTDIFKHALGLKTGMRKFEFQETEKGKDEAKKWEHLSSFILIQAFTSDVKKNWGAKNFQALLFKLLQSDEKLNVIFLGAPHEKEPLSHLILRCDLFRDRIHLAIVSFEGAYSLIKRAKLLVSGDTSIKHLAAGSDCPVFEISVGSSRTQNTGAYCANALVFQPKEMCYPCGHGSECKRPVHFCAFGVNADHVFRFIKDFLSGQYGIERSIENSVGQHEAHVNRVTRDPFGDFSLKGMHKKLFEKSLDPTLNSNLSNWIWKIMLEPRLLERFDENHRDVKQLKRVLNPHLLFDEWNKIESSLLKIIFDIRSNQSNTISVEDFRKWDELSDSIDLLGPLRRLYREILQEKLSSPAELERNCRIGLNRIRYGRVLINFIFEGEIENAYSCWRKRETQSRLDSVF